MGAKPPMVSEGSVYDAGQAGSAIRLDTPAWFAWLAAPHTTCFSYPLYDPARGYIVGFMTVRKERRQRGGMYWSVFRRCGRRVRKIYLGQSTTVTQARLQAIAEALRGTPDAEGFRSDAHRLVVSLSLRDGQVNQATALQCGQTALLRRGMDRRQQETFAILRRRVLRRGMRKCR